MRNTGCEVLRVQDTKVQGTQVVKGKRYGGYQGYEGTRRGTVGMKHMSF